MKPLTSNNLLDALPTRFAFFTGKGGVGKTSLAAAAAVTLADQGKRVLLVCTDPASNLDETFHIKLNDDPTKIPGVANLWALNIDPDQAANSYRERVIAPLRGQISDDEISGLQEQLSGACTTEIAAFDEFASILADSNPLKYDQVIFDTAPTGHTLRLLSLPKAWTNFFQINERGASCLGPHTALKNQQALFEKAFHNLTNPQQTSIILVARPDFASLNEANRTAIELSQQGLHRQTLILNAVYTATDPRDELAISLQQAAQTAIQNIPEPINRLETYTVPLRSFNTIGVDALRQLLAETMIPSRSAPHIADHSLQNLWHLTEFVTDLAKQDHALVLVMGKGGVGKTTIAAAIAVALAQKGVAVHLSTTDPAAHIASTVDGTFPHLKISRIDPHQETLAYTERILASKGKDLDPEGLALLREDLASPCTEEVAVFHAFSRLVLESRRGIVILDTAPTGHTLLLLDAAGSYHREMMRKMSGFKAGQMTTPLMQLKATGQSNVILVTLPETTPVSEAAALQEDLRRAGVEPVGWVVNRCLTNSGVTDPLLVARAQSEMKEIHRVMKGMAKKTALLPWTKEPPIGVERLLDLIEKS